MSNFDRPDASIPGTATRPTAPPTPAGGPPLASPPPQPVDDHSAPADAGREVAGHARSEVEGVAQHAAEKAHDVAETAKSEVRDVVDEARHAVRQQADRQSEVAAGAISRFRDDLQAMAGGAAPRDATAEYLQKAARSLDGVVERLERDGIEGALSGLRSFARRNPGGFLAASAGAGFAVARVLRNADHPQQVREQPRPTRAGDDQEIDLTGQTGAAVATGRTAPGPQVESPLVGREIR